jgi:hypothetical protein
MAGFGADPPEVGGGRQTWGVGGKGDAPALVQGLGALSVATALSQMAALRESGMRCLPAIDGGPWVSPSFFE